MNKIDLGLRRELKKKFTLHLTKVLGIRVVWLPTKGNVLVGVEECTLNDLLFRVRFTNNFQRSDYVLEESSSNVIFLCNYIKPERSRWLIAKKGSYFEISGNLHIQGNGIFLHIEGNESSITTRIPKPEKKIGLFQSASNLKLVFGLLQFPELKTKSQRELAQMMSISLGQANKALKELANRQYLTSFRGKKVLRKRKELLERWVIGYQEVLSHKLILGYWSLGSAAQNLATFHRTKNVQNNLLWGGEPGASLLTDGYLKPAIFTNYTENLSSFKDAVNSLFPTHLSEVDIDLRESSQTGYGVLFQKFWNDECLTEPLANWPQHSAPPLLVYADLMASGEPRNQEVAAIVYEKWIQHLL